MVKWEKKTCMNMHEMLVFGIEIYTCVVGVYAYVCVHILTQMLVIICLPVPRLSLKSDTECWQPWLSLGKWWE